MTQLLGIRAYARRRGVSHTAVGKAIRSGRLSRSVVREPGKPPKVDAELADEEWRDATDPAQQREPNGQALMYGGERKRKAEPTDEGLSFARVRTVREGINAQLAQLELDRERGRLVDRDDVRAQAFESARRVRDRLLGVPVRLGPVVAGRTDPTECEKLIRAELDVALQELSTRDA